MDLHTALHTRRTVQRFADAPVPDAVVARALDAANQAPNHKLTWPWRFTWVGPEAREGIFRVNVRLKSALAPCTPEKEALIRAKMMNPAHLIVVGQVLADDPFRRQEDYAACCCAIHNLCLSLHADGVGSKWSTGGVTRDPETYRLAGVDPEVEQIIGFVWVGMPEVMPRGPLRPPVEQLIRRTP